MICEDMAEHIELKSMRHALIINHNAGSPYHGPNFRSYYTARGWVHRGMRATIVCSAFSHKLNQLPQVDGTYAVEMIDGIRYVWLKTTPFSGNIGRMRNYVEFRCQLDLVSKIVKESVDFVVCSSPPPFWIWYSWHLASLKNAALIFEVRDLWPDVIFETSKFGYINPAAWYMKVAEWAAYRHSNAVVAVNESALKIMRKRGLDEEKFRAIPNGTEMNNLDDPVQDSEEAKLCRSLKGEGKFVIGYSGALSQIYGLTFLIEAAKVLRNENITFVLAGTGPYERALQEIAQELPNVYLTGWIPKDKLLGFLTSVDVCYASLLNVRSFAFGSDSTKLYEYMKAAKPVLHAISDENSVVVRAHCGKRVAPESVDAVVNGIRSMASMEPKSLCELGANGWSYVQKNRSYEVLTTKWMQLFDELSENQPT